MNQIKFQKLVDTFFNCNREEILQVFKELLGTTEAEEHLYPSALMSRNYETAQENPEIHTLPGNLKDARDAIFPYFWGTDDWSSKLHLENVKGPASFASLVGVLACLLKNPNLCIDTYSQRSNELEVKAITALANLLFYHTESPWGVFTMGGTISNFYGAKIGIEKVLPGAMQRGIQGERLAGIVSQAAHYSNATLAGWLGIGTDNLHYIPTDANCSLRIDVLAERLDLLYSNKVRVAFIIATFGTTDAFGIDDIASIRRTIEEKAHHYGMPVPQLHVDAAVGWPLCFLTEYDLKRNPLELSPALCEVLPAVQAQATSLMQADSITVDFHKMGWGHYPSSAFIVNRRDDLRLLSRTKEEIPYFCEADWRRDPALFTMECSRPAIGPYSVMASLNGIGLTGFQMLVAHAMEMADYLRKKLAELDYCQVLNPCSLGPHVVWWVLPKGRNAAEIYSQLEKGTVPEKNCHRYFAEIHRLFEKRDAIMDHCRDARLSFTTNMGYLPHGVALPAWKAVFFNPKTDRQVIDDLVGSIEEL